MPWTFSHPAAVLPFARWAPDYLNLPALMCGAIAPDIGYYIWRYDISNLAHTAVGSVLAGVPLALLCLLFFYLLRRPLWFLLPQPHRSAVAPLLESRPWRRKSFWLVAAVSALLGVWTHNIWDSFTHYHGWVVERVPLLQGVMVRLGGIPIAAHRVLQHFSSLVGAAALTLAYLSWFRKQPRVHVERGGRGDVLRYVAVIVAAAVSLAVAIPLAQQETLRIGGPMMAEMLIVQLALRGAAVFAVIVLLYSAVYAVAVRAR